MTDITIVLDRTGSMESIKDDVIGGFNRFVEEQKKVPDPARLTLIQFDSQDDYEVVYDEEPLDAVTPLTAETYQPRAATPLLDCLWKALNQTIEAEKVLFCIITDGLENASKFHSREEVRALLEQKRKQGWVFMFVCADENAIKEGVSLGIPQSNVARYSRVAAGQTMEVLSHNVAAYRATGDAKSAEFTAAARADMMGAEPGGLMSESSKKWGGRHVTGGTVVAEEKRGKRHVS